MGDKGPNCSNVVTLFGNLVRHVEIVSRWKLGPNWPVSPSHVWLGAIGLIGISENGRRWNGPVQSSGRPVHRAKMTPREATGTLEEAIEDKEAWGLQPNCVFVATRRFQLGSMPPFRDVPPKRHLSFALSCLRQQVPFILSSDILVGATLLTGHTTHTNRNKRCHEPENQLARDTHTC